MYSTAWVNQSEIKETCIEFAINNVSPQCNVKIILNLKVEEILRDYSPNFMCNKLQPSQFCLALSEAYS